MKTLVMLCIFFVASNCTSQPIIKAPVSEQNFEKINRLFNSYSNLENVENSFGKVDKIEGNNVTYFFPKTNIPQMYFEFQNNKMTSALLILEKNEIEKFKVFLTCDWKEEKTKTHEKDLIQEIYSANCEKKFVRIKYLQSLKSYEIWWKRALLSPQ
jgi:hypothetical protein